MFYLIYQIIKEGVNVIAVVTTKQQIRNKYQS